jgi:hypothetical protein
MTAPLVLFLCAEICLADWILVKLRALKAAADDVAFIEQCYWLDAVKATA